VIPTHFEAERLTEHPEEAAVFIDELETAAKRLLSALAGVEAGYCAGIVAETLQVRTPGWMHAADAQYAVELMARILLGGVGVELQEIGPDGSEIVVAPMRQDRQIDPARLMTAVAGLRILVPDTAQFVVTSQDNEVLISVDAAALRAAQEGAESTRDLAVTACFYTSRVARGDDRNQALLGIAATQLVLTARLSRSS
jgi:hypothetical protein